MNDLEALFAQRPFSVRAPEKRTMLVDHLNRLTTHHRQVCEAYARIYRAWPKSEKMITRLDQFPYLPVRLFKELDLKSIDDKDVIKTLTSSGTTSAKVSRIFLDRQTSRLQTKALAAIVMDFIGKKRLPMLIIDCPGVVKDRRLYSARGAGILGMANFGRDHLYVLDDDMNLRRPELNDFLGRHAGTDLLLFGFTYMVWQHFYRELQRSQTEVDLSRGVLIHSGGWKKLTEEAVDNTTFKASLQDVCGLEKVHNFYGMVEQTGSVFMECEVGHLHAPVFSDIIVRDPNDWSPLEPGQRGVVELLSILPHSYPGHVLLTEDVGEILGEDDCSCGRFGRYFRIHGRIPRAESRGCSDTYAEEVARAV